ncbi:MAG: hypothetical protein KKH61_21345 [Gammaproteobacteria bacterium]|uniref:Uncharacterized protein n=1 Tax=viral metagenome TaxID=1070528 RepID=A0A6H1ZAR9_9ZZZZ|nr:hypothetical protein [Gammaproteobacteria bacterium]
MFTSLDKALTGLVMAVLYLANSVFGINLGIDVDLVNGIFVALTPVLVWLIPNKRT